MSRRGDEKGGDTSSASARSSSRRTVSHRWRDYRTASGRRPIKQFLDRLGDEDLASVIAAMKEVRQHGLKAARHLDGEIYEVRADGKGVIYRILFAPQGKRKQVFLSLEALKKKRQKTPRRRFVWRSEGCAIGSSEANDHIEFEISPLRCYLRYSERRMQ